MSTQSFLDLTAATARGIATLLAALLSRARLLSIRLRYPQVSLGSGCSVLPGTRVRATDGGRIKLGNGIDLGRNVEITCKYGEIRIGDHSFLGPACTIVARTSVRIGRDALIGEGVSIRDQDHGSDLNGVPYRLQDFRSEAVTIGDNVWLGARATILRGVSVGDNAIVAAHAVVTDDVPAGAVVAGVPARVVKTAEERLSDPARSPGR